MRMFGHRARPYPSSLPQERGNHWPRFGNTRAQVCGGSFSASGRAAAMTQAAFEPSRDAKSCPLSPGENTGVRASVLFLIAFVFLAFAFTASAHEVRPAYFELRQ